MKSSNEEMINRYFEQEMSEVERFSFEQRLKADPVLAEEFDLQNRIVDSLKERRRLELKARLDHIKVQPPIYQTLTAKLASIAGVTAIVGVGAYYLISSSDNVISSNIELSRQDAIEFHITEIPQVPEVQAIATPEPEEARRPARQRDRKTQEQDNGNLALKLPAETEVARPRVVQPDMWLPDRDMDQEAVAVPEAGGMNGVNQLSENLESKVAVEVVSDRRNRFHYQFYNSKLYLLGDFSEMPYEIIELKGQSGIKYFLYYNGSYYRLNQGVEKPTPLVELDDPALIRELKVIQTNK